MMYRGMGAVDYAGASWCGSGNPFMDFFCPAAAERSTIEQIVMDESNYGGHLSLEAKRAAEQMAREAIAADNPCNYSEISGMSWPRKVLCGFEEDLGLKGKPAQDFTTVALIVAGVAAFSLLKR